MSRGPGVCQRQIQDAITRKQHESFHGHVHPSRWFTLNMCGLEPVVTSRTERVSMARAVHRMAEAEILETTSTNPYDWRWMPTMARSIASQSGVPGRKLWFRPLPSQDIRAVEKALQVNDPSDLGKEWDETSIDRLSANDVLRVLISWRYQDHHRNELDGWLIRAHSAYTHVENALPPTLLRWIALGVQGRVDEVRNEKSSPSYVFRRKRRPRNLRPDQWELPHLPGRMRNVSAPEGRKPPPDLT